MDFRFDLKLDTKDIERTLQNEIVKKSQSIVNELIVENFRSPGYYGYTPGTQYTRIKQMINDKLSNQESQDKIQSIIDASWDAALEKATHEAIAREAMKIATKKIKKEKNIAQYCRSMRI